MTRKRPTVADVRAMKGKYQYTMLRVETMEELEAAEQAGIDMVSVPPDLMCDPQFRDAAPGLFAVPGLNYFDVGTTDDFIRWSFRMVKASADAVYCSASLQTVRRLSRRSHSGDWPCGTYSLQAHMDGRLQGGWQDRRQRHANFQRGQGV